MSDRPDRHPTAGYPDPGMPSSPRTAMLSFDVYEHMKSLIMNHSIAPGARLNIDGAAREFGVSQTPVREALARLESDGLVTKLPLKGYRATNLLSRKELQDLYEFRLLLEPFAARRAALGISPEAVRLIREELSSCPTAPRSGDYEAYKELTAHDSRFHQLLLELAGNRAISTAIDRTHCHLHVFRLSYDAPTGTRAIEEHQRIADSVIGGRPDDAETAMRIHLEDSRDRILAVMGAERPNSVIVQPGK